MEEETWPDSLEEALSVLKMKIEQRRTSETKKNGSSSRSHLLVCLRIYHSNEEIRHSGRNNIRLRNAIGKVTFFDMAGK